jgi:hypothetical protein
MQGEKHVGSIWNVQLNAKAILDSGIKLNSDEWILFTTIHSMFGTKWAKKLPVGEDSYVLVSNKFIKQQLVAFPDLANISDVTLWRKVKKLEDAGLLVRHDKNSEKAKCYMGLGENADFFSNAPLSELKDPPFKNESPPLSELKDYNSTKDNSTRDNVSASDSASESLYKEKKVPKKKLKLTRIEAIEFYENEKANSLKTELPPELVAAAAARRPQVTMDHLTKAYSELVRYMMEPSPKWESGMWECVLTRPKQLTFVQFCRLILELDMTRDQVKGYLDQWENKGYENNKNLYATMSDWRRRETTNPQKSFNGNGGANKVMASKPSSTNEDYSA